MIIVTVTNPIPLHWITIVHFNHFLKVCLIPDDVQVVRIFTSSTFTDMLMERNTLMEYVYPKIKEYCREKHGLEYQVVDMRWGVRDEMTDEHMTTVSKSQDM